MDAHTKVSGTWKKLDGIHVKVSGTWKAVQAGYTKVSGTWKQFYAAVTYALSGETGINGSQPGGTSNAGVRMNADGTVDKLVDTVYSQIDTATDYIIPNSAVKTAIRFRATNNGDALDAGSSATGSWLSAPCEWYVETSGVPVNLDVDVEISIDSGSSTHDTGAYTGSAEA